MESKSVACRSGRKSTRCVLLPHRGRCCQKRFPDKAESLIVVPRQTNQVVHFQAHARPLQLGALHASAWHSCGQLTHATRVRRSPALKPTMQARAFFREDRAPDTTQQLPNLSPFRLSEGHATFIANAYHFELEFTMLWLKCLGSRETEQLPAQVSRRIPLRRLESDSRFVDIQPHGFHALPLK